MRSPNGPLFVVSPATANLQRLPFSSDCHSPATAILQRLPFSCCQKFLQFDVDENVDEDTKLLPGVQIVQVNMSATLEHAGPNDTGDSATPLLPEEGADAAADDNSGWMALHRFRNNPQLQQLRPIVQTQPRACWSLSCRLLASRIHSLHNSLLRTRISSYGS